MNKCDVSEPLVSKFRIIRMLRCARQLSPKLLRGLSNLITIAKIKKYERIERVCSFTTQHVALPMPCPNIDQTAN